MGRFEGVIGYFETADDLRAAAAKAREARFDLDAYLPVGDMTAVEAAAPGESPVRWLALAGGLTGLAAALWMTIWMSWDYPLVTGGKPITSLPPFLVIAFEVMLLFAGAGAFIGLLLLGGLPRLVPTTSYRNAFAVDTFALLIRSLPGARDRERAEEILREAGAYEIRPILDEKRERLEETL